MPADSAMIRVWLECDSLGNIRLHELLGYESGRKAKPPEISIKDNVLTARIKIEKEEIKAQIKDTNYRHITQNERVIVKEVEVNRLTVWQRLWVRTGQMAAFIAAALTAYYIIKKTLRIWLKTK